MLASESDYELSIAEAHYYSTEEQADSPIAISMAPTIAADIRRAAKELSGNYLLVLKRLLYCS
jgi:hypothetical protein